MPFYQQQMPQGFQSIQPGLSSLAEGLALRNRPDYVQARANMQDPSAWLGDEGWRPGTPDYIKQQYSLYVDPNKAGDLIVLQKGVAPPSNYKARDDYGSLLTLPGWEARPETQRLMNPQNPPQPGQAPTLDPFKDFGNALVGQPGASAAGMPSYLQALGYGPAPQATPSQGSSPIDLLSKLQQLDTQGNNPWFQVGENLGSFSSKDMNNAANPQQQFAEQYTQLQQKFNTSKGDQEINISNEDLPKYTQSLGMLLKSLDKQGVPATDPLRRRIEVELNSDILALRKAQNNPELFSQFMPLITNGNPDVGQAFGVPLQGIQPPGDTQLTFNPEATQPGAPLRAFEGLEFQTTPGVAAPNTSVILPQLMQQPGAPAVTPEIPQEVAPLNPEPAGTQPRVITPQPSQGQPVSYQPQYENVPAQMGYRHSYQPMNVPWEQLQGLPAEQQLAILQQYANTQGIPQENRFGQGGLVDPNYANRNQQRAQMLNTMQTQQSNANVTEGQQLENQFSRNTMMDRQNLIKAQVQYNQAMAENMKAQAQQGGLSMLDIAKLQNLQTQTQKLQQELMAAPVQALEKSLASSAALLKQGKGDSTTHSKLLLEYAMRKDPGLLSKSPEEIQKSIVSGNIVPEDFWGFLPWASKSGKLNASDVGSVRDQILMELYGGNTNVGGSTIDWAAFTE